MISFQQYNSAAIPALQLWGKKTLQNLSRFYTREQKAFSHTKYMFTYIMLHTHATYRTVKKALNPPVFLIPYSSKKSRYQHSL